MFTDMISRAESDGGGQGEFKVRVDGREEIMWWHICAAPAAYEGQAATRLAGFDAGAMDFLTKPVKAKEVARRVKALLWAKGFPI